MSGLPTWPGELSREDAIRILDSATDKDDPFWDDITQDHYDETTETLPSIMDVFAALGVSAEEYAAAVGADGLTSDFDTERE